MHGASDDDIRRARAEREANASDEPLREEDVTLSDRLDDRVSEADELPPGDDGD